MREDIIGIHEHVYVYVHAQTFDDAGLSAAVDGDEVASVSLARRSGILPLQTRVVDVVAVVADAEPTFERARAGKLL